MPTLQSTNKKIIILKELRDKIKQQLLKIKSKKEEISFLLKRL